MTADTAHIQRELNDLRLHWDEAYKITYHPGQAEPCHAERLDDGTVLAADSPWALRNKIIDDYSVRPMPSMATSVTTMRPRRAGPPAGTSGVEEGSDAC